MLKRTLDPGRAADYVNDTEGLERHFSLSMDEEGESVQNTAVRKVSSLQLKLENLFHVPAD